jgi:hypothetical protein
VRSLREVASIRYSIEPSGEMASSVKSPRRRIVPWRRNRSVSRIVNALVRRVIENFGAASTSVRPSADRPVAEPSYATADTTSEPGSVR